MTGRGRPKAKAPKRANGEDSLYQKDGKGSWYCSGMVVGLGRRTRAGKTPTEAAAKLNQLREDNERFDLSRGDLTVGELTRAWLDDYTDAGAEASTISTRTHRVETHILGDSTLSAIKTSRLRPENVKDWLRRKKRTGYDKSGRHMDYSTSSLRDFRLDLIQILTWGQAQRVPGLDWNPAKFVPPLQADAEENEKRALPRVLRDQLIVELRGSTRRYAAFMLIALHTGARPGEIHGLRWDDIDEEERTITFRRALKRRSGGVPIGLGPLKTAHKTGRREREVRVPGEVLDALRIERKLQAELRRDWWPKEWEGLVFLGETGRPPSPSNMRRTLRLLIADAGLPADLHDFDPYELRHTCASLLIEAGVLEHEIIDQLGWTDGRMLERNYRHRSNPITGDAGLAAMGEAS